MQITKQDVDQLTAKVTMVIEPADYEANVAKELTKIRQKAQVPGFRPGMVPKGMVKKMYGKGVLAEEVNKLIGEKLYEYFHENKIEILGEPLSNDEETPELDFDNQTTFTFVFDVALAPEFSAKLDGHNKLTYYDVEVSEEMINNQVQGYAQRFGEYQSVDSVEENDMLRGDLVEQVEDGKHVEAQVLSAAYMQPEEKAKFVGAKKGDIITFNPKKAFQSEAEISSLLKISKEEAAAIESDFTFTITEITRHQAATVDQALFDKVYGEGAVKDEAEFRARVQAEIKANMDEDAKYKFGLDCKAAVMKKMEKVEFPEELLKRWVLTSNKDNITPEKLEEDWTKMLDELRWQLAKDQLLKQFEIQVQQDDVNAYAREIARMQFLQYGLSHVEDEYLDNFAKDMLKDENQLRGIIERVAENKIYDALKAVVKLETKAISHEEFGKLFA